MLEDLEKAVEEQTKILVDRLAQEARDEAQMAFESAEYAGHNDVQVRMDNRSIYPEATIYAEGGTVQFIEFGTGILRRSAPAEAYGLLESPHEVKAHGRYGRRAMSIKGWDYMPKGEIQHPPKDDEPSRTIEGFIHTWGNDATPVMYETRKRVIEKYPAYAKEVFK